MKKVTLQDIANELGVSKGTVDRALHSRPDISATRRQRVLEAAEKHGYKPNIAARLLSLKSNSLKIGVIIQGNPLFFWDAIRYGIRQAEEEFNGCDMEIIYRTLRSSRRTDEVTCAIDYFIDLKVQGIILVPVNDPQVTEAINKAVDAGITVVTMNDDIEDSKRLFYVGPQMRQSGRTAGELIGKFLMGKGRVMVIRSSIESLEYRERLEGFNKIINESYPNICITKTFTLKCDHGEESNIEAFSNILKNLDFDGIYDVDGASLYIIGEMLKEATLPHKVVLVGHEISNAVKSLIDEGIIDASISQDPCSQGYHALKFLCNYLAGDEKPKNERIFTRLDIIIRENIVNQSNIINPYFV